jgi:hypothetical protein
VAVSEVRQLGMNPFTHRDGPSSAEVLQVEDQTVLVRLHHARTEEVLRAELAVIGYEPRPTDRVLVLPAEEGLFVVGVLGEARTRRPAAQETVVISATQRIVLEAPALELRGDTAAIVATSTTLTSQTLEVDAKRVVERAEETYRYASESAHLNAGTIRSVADDAHEVIARRASMISEEDTVIDGARVLLG